MSDYKKILLQITDNIKIINWLIKIEKKNYINIQTKRTEYSNFNMKLFNLLN